MKVFFNFAPHLGDLFISRGLASGLWREKGEKSVTCTYLTDKDIYESFQAPFFEIKYSADKEDYNIPIIHKGIRLEKVYKGGNRFEYRYYPTEDFLKELHNTFTRQLNDGVFDGVEKIYSLHMQFNVIYLGYWLEKHHGIKAEGYKLEEKDGSFIINVENVFYKDGIIPHLAEVLGINVTFEDFAFPTEKVEDNKVLFIPDSRYPDNLTNQHWDLGATFFQSQGYEVEYAQFGKTYHSIPELEELIKRNKIIMCNDSFSYHLAWGMEKDIILKQKLGVIEEWSHRNELFETNGKTYSIPPAPVYEEGYIQHLINALQYLERGTQV